MKKAGKLEENHRSMDASQEEGELFLFPKRNPPVTIRAKTRQEAEEQLNANDKEI